MELLSTGSTGPEVGFLQEVLTRMGYYTGEIDYIYGPQTKAAVIAAQRSLSLTPDGIVGRRTREALAPYFSGNSVYTIKSGDTLYGISERTGIGLKRIIAANPFAAAENLTVGQKILLPYAESVVPTNLKYSYGIMMINLMSLEERYPFIVSGTAGFSALGRPIPFIRLGRGTKRAFYNGSHHANEWLGSLLLMKFTENLCAAYVDGENLGGYNIDELFATSSIYIIPMVNPDGVDLVTGALNNESSAYRYAESLSRPNIPFPLGWKANIVGTDLNLNYAAGWEIAKRNKAALGVTSPAPRDYVGPYPFSEPETRSVAQFIVNQSPDIMLAYHSAGEIIYWKYLNYNPPRSYEIALDFARISGYSAEITPDASGYAGCKDWFIQEYNRPGYTIEIGTGASPLPLSQFPKIYADNLGILLSAPLQI